MKTIIFLVMIFLSGYCFAGETVYTDDDLQKYYTPGYREAQRYNETIFQQKRIEDEIQEEAEKQKEVETFTVNRRTLHIGMSKDEVIREIGKPSDINTSGGSYGVHEQWVYSQEVANVRRGHIYWSKHTYLYLYFDNNILSSYQLR